MRDLTECQAEVFRRSEKRIKERKQRRRHILMVCVPLVLCIGLWSAFSLPGMLSGNAGELGDPAAPECAPDGIVEDAYSSTGTGIARIIVSGPDFSKTHTQASDILRISDSLYACSTRGQDSGTTGSLTSGSGFTEDNHKENATQPTESVADSDHAESVQYRITLVMYNENLLAYSLTGNTLTDLTTNQAHPLTPEQTKELKDLLGIPHP